MQTCHKPLDPKGCGWPAAITFVRCTSGSEAPLWLWQSAQPSVDTQLRSLARISAYAKLGRPDVAAAIFAAYVAPSQAACECGSLPRVDPITYYIGWKTVCRMWCDVIRNSILFRSLQFRDIHQLHQLASFRRVDRAILTTVRTLAIHERCKNVYTESKVHRRLRRSSELILYLYRKIRLKEYKGPDTQRKISELDGRPVIPAQVRLIAQDSERALVLAPGPEELAKRAGRRLDARLLPSRSITQRELHPSFYTSVCPYIAVTLTLLTAKRLAKFTSSISTSYTVAISDSYPMSGPSYTTLIIASCQMRSALKYLVQYEGYEERMEMHSSDASASIWR